MFVYYTVFILCFCFCCFDFIESKVARNVFYLFFTTFLVLLVGLRSVGIDNDSVVYQEMFQRYSNSTIAQIIEGGYGYVEKGYVFLNYLIGKFTTNVRVLFFLVAIFTGYFNYRYILLKSKYPFVSLSFYLSFFYLYRDFTQIRYALSCSIIFWAIDFYVKKKHLKSIICFVIALYFHNSTLIFIPVLICMKFIDNKLFYLFLPFVMFVLGRFFNFLTILIAYGIGGSHLTIYEGEQGGGSLSISIVGYFLMLLSYFLNALWEGQKNRSEDGNIYWKLVALGTSFNLFALDISIFQRFSFVLFQFSVLLLPLLFNAIKTKFKNVELYLGVYFLIAVFLLYYGFRMVNVNLIRPYEML